MQELQIVHATLDEMEFLLSLANKEGWNPGLNDALPFYSTDPKGFFIARLGDENIGCISAVAYNSEFGFIGFYIVVPKYRGQGHGIKLWNRAISYLGSRSVGLDGVISQVENYKKSNFKLCYRNIRFEGKAPQYISSGLKSLKAIPIETLLSYDSPIFGLKRKAFLETWIAMPNASALAKVEKGRLLGYGAIRSCHKGYKVGPLFTDDQEIAKEILHGLLGGIIGKSFYLDVPEINQKALELAEELALKKTFETARMYTNNPPRQQLEKVFGVTTFELG